MRRAFIPRDGEAIAVTSLAALSVETVDMLSLVLIGSSTTRAVERGRRRFVYTPRGYAARLEKTP